MFSFAIDAETDIRLLEVRHAEEIAAVVDANREYLTPWMPWAPANTVETTRQYIQTCLDQFAKNNGFQAGIFVRGKYVGGIGFHVVDWVNLKTSMGYWIAQGFQGRGIMTRATAALIEHAFAEWKLNRVEIRAAVENVRSRAIPERLSFTQEGICRQVEKFEGMFRDHVVYGMLAAEWRGVRKH
ncbi:MAG: GNAT family N-acetyltransferase [Phycisphaerae bacterium]